MIKFSLLEISNYDWTGVSLFCFETEDNIYPLLHVEYTQETWKIFALFGLIKYIR